MNVITAELEETFQRGCLALNVLPFVVWVGRVLVGAL